MSVEPSQPVKRWQSYIFVKKLWKTPWIKFELRNLAHGECEWINIMTVKLGDLHCWYFMGEGFLGLICHIANLEKKECLWKSKALAFRSKISGLVNNSRYLERNIDIDQDENKNKSVKIATCQWLVNFLSLNSQTLRFVNYNFVHFIHSQSLKDKLSVIQIDFPRLSSSFCYFASFSQDSSS